MNNRARNRLVGVTVIVLMVILALFLASGNKTAAYYKTVNDTIKAVKANDPKLVGERVKVGGAVVAGSWDKKSNPMTFSIRDEKDTSGKSGTLKVVYSGSVPSTFGDGVVAIVTGTLDAQGTITADEMITKCPSKYSSMKGAEPLADLLASKDSMRGKTVKTAAYIKAGTIAPPGGSMRFIATAQKGGGVEVPVVYEGALPAGMVDGSSVVITGALQNDGLFLATDVALSK